MGEALEMIPKMASTSPWLLTHADFWVGVYEGTYDPPNKGIVQAYEAGGRTKIKSWGLP